MVETTAPRHSIKAKRLDRVLAFQMVQIPSPPRPLPPLHGIEASTVIVPTIRRS